MKSQTTISIDVELMQYLDNLTEAKSKYLSRLIRLDIQAKSNIDVQKSMAELEKQVVEKATDEFNALVEDESYLIPK